jgi:hypothetical protein
VPHPDGARRDTHTIATHPDAPDRVYAAAGDGYAESRDRGASWHYPQRGLAHQYCWSVAVHPADAALVLLSAAAGAHTAHYPERAETVVYRRHGDPLADETVGWGPAMDGLGLAEDMARAVLTTGPDGRAYALTNRGLFHTVDDGWTTWERSTTAWPDVAREEVGRGLAVVA